MTNKEILNELRAHCMAKEGAAEEYPWENHVGWKVKGKLFAIGGEDSNRVTVKSSVAEQAALVQHPNIEKAAYVGRFGWVTVTIVDREILELTKDLIDESYEAIAGKGKKTKKRGDNG